MQPRWFACALIVAVAINPIPAAATAYLCIEDAVTGFDWEGGKWVQKNFLTSQWIVRKYERGDETADTCFQLLMKDGLLAEPPPGSVMLLEYGCYSRSEVGTEPGFVHRCKENWDGDGTLRLVECTDYLLPYRFIPNAEYISTTTYPAPRPNGFEGNERDSISVAVGRCSVVSE